jgi:SAM-dependent methyltransferase
VGRHERIAELADLTNLGPDALEVVDLAAGYGRIVRAVLAESRGPVRVHAMDTASSLDDDVLHDERVRSVIADPDDSLPFPDGTMDRVLSLNVVEHVHDPVAHVADCYRVLRPGGLLVLAHSDWDTTLFTSEDDELTRTLVNRFVHALPQWAQRADGFMGRKLLGLASAAPFTIEHVETWADCHVRFDMDSVAWKVARGVVAAAADDDELSEAAAEWFNGLRRLSDDGRFLFTVTDVAVVLQRPSTAA